MTGIRLHLVVEGQTEERFVKEVLTPHLSVSRVWADARLIQVGRRAKRKFKGGLLRFHQLMTDVGRWIKEDGRPEARFTTMVDLYGYPADAPGYAEAQRRDPYARVARLEEGLAEAVKDPRFIPYIQLHEFEALLLADLSKWADYPIGDKKAIDALGGSLDLSNVELIDGGEASAPSKRIVEHIPGYEKAAHGPLLARAIGLDAIRAKCRHFHEWLTQLEGLAAT